MNIPNFSLGIGFTNSNIKISNNPLQINTANGLPVVSEKKSGNWIQKAIKNPGALHKQLGVPEDKKIPAAKLNAAAKKGGKLGQRARLAKTLIKLGKD